MKRPMRLIGYLLLACVLLSVVQAALSALVIIVVIMLLVGILCRPAETFGLMALGLVSSLFQTHPVAATTLVSLFLIAGIVLSLRGRNTNSALPPAGQLALPGPEEG